MKSFFSSIPLKYRYYFTIVAGIMLMVVLITLYSVNRAKSIIDDSIRDMLNMELAMMRGLFEREREHRTEKIRIAAKIAGELFEKKELLITGVQTAVRVTDQITGNAHEAMYNDWHYKRRPLYDDTLLVDRISGIADVSATVFQRIDSGYLRISTTIRHNGGERATGTYIPENSPVSLRLDRGENYSGRAFVVNDWYYTIYMPIRNEGKTVGALYVGSREKDLEKLREIFRQIKIGDSGYPFVFDSQGTLLIHPFAEGENWMDEPIVRQIIAQKNGYVKYRLNRDGIRKMTTFSYFEDFGVYLGATVPVRDISAGILNKIIINSVAIGLLVVIVLSILIYFVTAENIRNVLRHIERSDRKRKQVEAVLEQTEKQFKAIFNNSSDDIYVTDFNGNFLEVNRVATESLGYSREELLSMNIRDIKSASYRNQVENNLIRISKFGQYRYESENKTRDGRIIPVEMKSRIIDFKDKPAILTNCRDISERKEMDSRILSAIIQTEDNERKRIAADLHDGLAPILSTIKLYADLLKKGDYKKTDQPETIGNIEELVDMAISSTREISRNIRPNILQDFGLAAAVNDFASYINFTGAVKIRVDSGAYKLQQRGIEESILYQAIKELINNTMKHSSALNIEIELKNIDNQIIVYYREDGSGFDIQKAIRDHKGLGLNNIINKIKSLGGVIDYFSEPGKGMFFIASVKIAEKQESNGNR
jgi:PAS domain S-box-containing protein